MRRNCYDLTLVLILMIFAQFSAAQSPASASSPASATSPSSSSTAAFESQMLAYGGLNKIAKAIASEVCKIDDLKSPKTIVIIYDRSSFATLLSYEAFIANIRAVSASYRTLIPKEGDLRSALHDLFEQHAQQFQSLADKQVEGSDKQALLLHQSETSRREAMTSSISMDPISDAASLLSAIAISSNTENPGQVSIPDSAMAVALTRELNSSCSPQITVIYPPLFGNGSTTDYSSADIQAEIQALDDIRSVAHEAVDDINQQYIRDHSSSSQSESKKVTTGSTNESAKPPKVSNKKEEEVQVQKQSGSTSLTGNSVLTAALADVDKLYDNFMNSLLQVNSASGAIGSASVIQGYQLASLLRGCKSYVDEKVRVCKEIPRQSTAGEKFKDWAQPPAYVLLATVAAAGGTQHVHKTLWTALSTGDKISYSGGIVVNTALWVGVSKNPAYADVLRYRTPFSKIKDPADVTDVDAGDNLPKN